VILAKSDGRAVLTDFELAKLLDTGPTVSANWPDDVYRAPEVDAGAADERSDLYSWARVLIHAATGQRPSNEEGKNMLINPGLPEAVWRLATRCLAKRPSARPASVRDVLPVLQEWSS